jgi:predicted DCC family thiol-disulfide oxidoreductase YuxK
MMSDKLHSVNLKKHPVILFDGLCGLCNWSVRFVLKRDSEKKFLFSHDVLFDKYCQKTIDRDRTIILIAEDGCWIESEAVAKILKEIPGWRIIGILILIVPGFIRNSVYRLISRYRTKWFGRYNSCPVFPQEFKNRII